MVSAAISSVVVVDTLIVATNPVKLGGMDGMVVRGFVDGATIGLNVGEEETKTTQNIVIHTLQCNAYITFASYG